MAGSRLLIQRQNGGYGSGGDEIMVLPKVDAKNVEVARGISQNIYQIAVAAKVVFGL